MASSREWRGKNPVKYAYNTLKNNAKRRGKEFSLTLDQFKEFCIKTSYMKGKGTRAESYHIDRIDETKGYHIDNIQILTNRENVRKAWFFNDWCQRDEKMKYNTVIETPEDILSSMKRPEQKLQAECFKWAWNEKPETRLLLFHCPNERKMSPGMANIYKSIGVVAGIPDLVFIWEGKTHGIELKVAPRGKQSPKQKDVEVAWKNAGASYYICWDLEQFKRIIELIISER